MEPRWYQKECVGAIYRYLHAKSGNPCAVLPTGAGKSLVLAMLCKDLVTQWNGRAIILAHVKELLEQNAAKLQSMCPLIKVGLYSAGLKKRETDCQVLVAGIQSVYDKAEKLGRFDLILIDEAHLIPESGDGMYRQLIRDLIEINPDVRVIGLTATPYRTTTGMICSPEGVLNDICYSVGVRPLIAQGHLSKLIGRRAVEEIDTAGLKIRGGEFSDEAAEERFTESGIVARAAREVVAQSVDRKSVLIFCQTVEHAQQVAGHLRHTIQGTCQQALEELTPCLDDIDLGPEPLAGPYLPIAVAADWLEERGHPVEFLRRYLITGAETVGEIYGDTDSEVRARLIKDFREGRLKYLVNVNVLTTGFDAPNTDCIAILRATLSPGLFYQMVGRGFRVCEGKANCLILDFGRNIERHGPVDDIQSKPKGKKGNDGEVITRMCPECRIVVGPSIQTCPGCGYIWPVSERTVSHEGEADGEPLSKPAQDATAEVTEIVYRVHRKKDADESAPKTMRVTYRMGLVDEISEWVCVEHPRGGFAHRKATQWWAKRCAFPMPKTVVEAVTYAQHGLLAPAAEISTRTKKGEKFPEITDVVLDPRPLAPKPCPECRAVNRRCIVRYDDVRYPGQIVCGECSYEHGYATVDQVEHYKFIDDPDRTEWGGMLPAWIAGDEADREESEAPMDSDDMPELLGVNLLTEMDSFPDDCPF